MYDWKSIFEPFVNLLFPLKNKKIAGAKMLLNIITGLFGEIKKRKFITNNKSKKDKIIPDNYILLNQLPAKINV
jgi:hypothetical protein